ncbi:unnamed protein product, partial [Didymodactylos carnosus]
MANKAGGKYGRILQENIKAAAQTKLDLDLVLNQNEASIFDRYKEVGGDIAILFYGMLPLLSHFAQSSTYASMFKQLKPLNLYSIVIGPPGCGKSPNFKYLLTAATTVTKMFRHDYMKNIPSGGANTQSGNSVTNSPNGLALLKSLATGNVCLVNDEIDGVFGKWGIYNEKSTEEIPLLCASFDGIEGLSRSTSRTTIEINGAKLSVLGGTTGTHLANVLQRWSNWNGQD